MLIALFPLPFRERFVATTGAAGEFKKEAGNRGCSPCTAGTHCTCSQLDPLAETPGGRACVEPCTECADCAVGYYQDKTRQKDCVNCPVMPNGVIGFICPLTGMTWPLAKNTFWISGQDPTIFHDCAARPAACPGSPFARNTSRINALASRSSSSSHPAPDALAATCFRRSETRPDVQHSGWETMPHDGKQQRWSGDQTDAAGGLDCWDVVGASCAVGYAGAQHNKPCVECDTDHKPIYYADSSTQTCEACPPNSQAWLLGGVVIGSLVLAPLTIRFAGMAKHAGALTAPLMSMVNVSDRQLSLLCLSLRFHGVDCVIFAAFRSLTRLLCSQFLQSVDLFRQLNLHWPAQIKEFILRIASFFNLNINILNIHPECSLHLVSTKNATRRQHISTPDSRFAKCPPIYDRFCRNSTRSGALKCSVPSVSHSSTVTVS